MTAVAVLICFALLAIAFDATIMAGVLAIAAGLLVLWIFIPILLFLASPLIVICLLIYVLVKFK